MHKDFFWNNDGLDLGQDSGVLLVWPAGINAFRTPAVGLVPGFTIAHIGSQHRASVR